MYKEGIIPAVMKKEQIGELEDYEIEYGEKMDGQAYMGVRCEHNFGSVQPSLTGNLYCTNYKLIFKPEKKITASKQGFFSLPYGYVFSLERKNMVKENFSVEVVSKDGRKFMFSDPSG